VPQPHLSLGRLWPLALVAGALAPAYALGLRHYLSFQVLGEQQQRLAALVDANPVAAPAGFIALYAACVAVSIPGSAVLTLAAGLLFGTVLGAGYAVIGASIGAVLLFLAARYAIGDWLAAKAGPLMSKVRDGLRKDGFSYLLAIRLIPIVPFWLANLVPALAGMGLVPFAAATTLGIIPGTVVFASVGAGVGSVLGAG